MYDRTHRLVLGVSAGIGGLALFLIVSLMLCLYKRRARSHYGLQSRSAIACIEQDMKSRSPSLNSVRHDEVIGKKKRGLAASLRTFVHIKEPLQLSMKHRPLIQISRPQQTNASSSDVENIWRNDLDETERKYNTVVNDKFNVKPSTRPLSESVISLVYPQRCVLLNERPLMRSRSKSHGTPSDQLLPLKQMPFLEGRHLMSKSHDQSRLLEDNTGRNARPMSNPMTISSIENSRWGQLSFGTATPQTAIQTAQSQSALIDHSTAKNEADMSQNVYFDENVDVDDRRLSSSSIKSGKSLKVNGVLQRSPSSRISLMETPIKSRTETTRLPRTPRIQRSKVLNLSQRSKIRKGHRRQNCVRISISPSALSNDDRKKFDTLAEIREEEFPEQSSPFESEVESIIQACSSKRKSTRCEISKWRASLTPSSPTLSMLPLNRSDERRKSHPRSFMIEKTMKRLSRELPHLFGLPTPSSDLDDKTHLVSTEQWTTPTFELTRPSGEYNDDDRTQFPFEFDSSLSSPSQDFDGCLSPVSMLEDDDKLPIKPAINLEKDNDPQPEILEFYLSDSEVSSSSSFDLFHENGLLTNCSDPLDINPAIPHHATISEPNDRSDFISILSFENDKENHPLPAMCQIIITPNTSTPPRQLTPVRSQLGGYRSPRTGKNVASSDYTAFDIYEDAETSGGFDGHVYRRESPYSQDCDTDDEEEGRIPTKGLGSICSFPPLGPLLKSNHKLVLKEQVLTKDKENSNKDVLERAVEKRISSDISDQSKDKSWDNRNVQSTKVKKTSLYDLQGFLR